MTLNTREIRLAMGTLILVLVVFGGVLIKDKVAEWVELADTKDGEELVISKYQARIARKAGYLRRIETIKLVLPEYPVGRDVKSQLLQQLNGLAARHRLGITSVDPDKEREVGELGLYRLSVSVAWSGDLEQLTRFLFDMQQQGAVIDVRQLTVKADPRANLSGSMKIDFAYNRVAASASTPKATASSPVPGPAPATDVKPSPPEVSVAAPASPAAPPAATGPAPVAAPDPAPALPVLPGASAPKLPSFPVPTPAVPAVPPNLPSVEKTP